MKYRADREDLLDIGLEQGREEERTKLIENMLSLDMPYEQIAKIVDLPVEEIYHYVDKKEDIIIQ